MCVCVCIASGVVTHLSCLTRQRLRTAQQFNRCAKCTMPSHGLIMNMSCDAAVCVCVCARTSTTATHKAQIVSQNQTEHTKSAAGFQLSRFDCKIKIQIHLCRFGKALNSITHKPSQYRLLCISKHKIICIYVNVLRIIIALSLYICCARSMYA